MTRFSLRRVTIGHAQGFVTAFLVSTLLISGCAVTGPDRNGGATANNPPGCQSRSGYDRQEEFELPCREPAVRNRYGSTPYRNNASRAGLYVVAAIMLLHLLKQEENNRGDCWELFTYEPQCD
jgi:hypothetical protein